MRNVTLTPFETCYVHTIINVKGHEWRVNVAINPPTNSYSGAVVTVPSYSHLKPGSSQIEVCLHNLSGRTVTLKAKSAIAQVTPMNAVPTMVAQKEESVVNNGIDKIPEALPKLTSEQKEKVFQKVDLSGTKGWTIEEQAEVQGLIKEYGSLFALDSQDLGCTSVVKQSIKLTDYTPFKEKYRCIPPHQYKELKSICRRCWTLVLLDNLIALGLLQCY